ncbi:MAG: hypothetical protein J2P43_02240 [Candidatus Dormibacteraeota bacterium]|nr:hypothetical protein [Candidatus Dormibacteraeota bacterium]
MTWIWATLLLILVAPFVLWPLLTSAAAATVDGDEAGPQEPPASDP